MTLDFAIIDAPIVLAIVGIAVLLFGADKIPKLARSMGEAKKEYETASRPQAPAPAPTQPGPVETTPSQPSAPPPQAPAPPQ